MNKNRKMPGIIDIIERILKIKSPSKIMEEKAKTELGWLMFSEKNESEE